LITDLEHSTNFIIRIACLEIDMQMLFCIEKNFILVLTKYITNTKKSKNREK